MDKKEKTKRCAHCNEPVFEDKLLCEKHYEEALFILASKRFN